MTSGSVRDEDHRHHHEAHRDADRQHVDRPAQRDVARGDDGAEGDADGDDALQERRLRHVEAQRLAAHSITMNCSVAPAPQNSVVVASEIWPSRSRHSSALQCANSRMRNSGLRFTIRRSTPVSGMNQLKTAATT